MKFLFLSLILFAVPGFAATLGFANGNQLTVVPIQGQVVVDCPGGVTVNYLCRDTAMDPASYDYFVGPQGVVADQVALSCFRPDGSRRDHTVAYDSVQGRSSEAVNLWISTLFQKPLLQVGANQVSYAMLRQSQTVASGVVTVNVVHGDLRTCPATRYNSLDSSDCQSQYSVCQRYFEQYDYCR